MVMNRIGGWTFHCEVNEIRITIDTYQHEVYYRTVVFDISTNTYYVNGTPENTSILSDSELTVIDELRYQN